MREDIYNYLASAGGLSVEEILLNFAASIVVSIIISVCYKLGHTRAIYSKKFNSSLVMMVLITTLIMAVIGNNIALSLGMVGALSIIRFRTAIKDARDAAYIFWAIAVGIACGVSDFLVAAIGSTIIFLYLVFFGQGENNERKILVVHCDATNAEEVKDTIDKLFSFQIDTKVESVNKQTNQTEFIFECSKKTMEAAGKNGFSVSEVSKIKGVTHVSLVQQESDINQ